MLYKLVCVATRTGNSDLLTIKAAAELLGVSEQTLRRWDEAGKLRARRHPMNGYRLYPRDEVLAVKRRIYSEVDEAR
jgi:excisionase family DNA binding protein